MPQPPLTYFPSECSVLGTPIKDVGEPFHIEGLHTPLALNVRMHVPAPCVPQ